MPETLEKLKDQSQKLNNASNSLGKQVEALNAIIQRLNLGVTAWHPIAEGGEDDGDYWIRAIGYARIGKKWGIGFREERGNRPAKSRKTETWHFNDAPRWMRVDGISKIPDLLETIVERADDMVSQIKGADVRLQEIVTAMREAESETNTPK